MTVKEGYMPFGDYRTYYRIVGEAAGGKAPLVLLHGGPGSTHNYFELLDELATDGRQLIMYDQLGCGRSSMPDQPALWRKETWVKELMALRNYLHLDQIHLMGQSWGGMLALIYLCDYQPAGVKSLVLSSTLPDAKLWAQEQHRMIRLMAPSDQAAIAAAEKNNDYTTKAYQAANQRYMEQHAASVPTAASPEPLRRPKQTGTQSYLTAWGPNEYSPTGTLSDYNYTAKLKNLTQPTWITSGTDDLCTPLVAKTMYDRLPKAKWTLFAHSRHMPFVDERAQYLKQLKIWLEQHDQ